MVMLRWLMRRPLDTVFALLLHHAVPCYACSDADSEHDAEMVDEEHIGVNAIMGSKKRKAEGTPDAAAAPAAKEPKVGGKIRL